MQDENVQDDTQEKMCENVPRKKVRTNILIPEHSAENLISSSQSTDVYMPSRPRSSDTEVSVQSSSNTLQSSLFLHIKNLLESEDVSRERKIQILTLLPPNWSYDSIMDHFQGVNWRMIKTSKYLLTNKEILGVIDHKIGKLYENLFML